MRCLNILFIYVAHCNDFQEKIKNLSSNNYMLIYAFIHIQIYEGVKKSTTAVILKKIYLLI